MAEFQAFSTFAVAVFAAAIAFGQWWTARQKLALDLFEKRFSIFMDIRRVASEAFQLGKFSKPGEINEIVARARFLFAEDINDALKAFHATAGRVELAQPNAGSDLVIAYEKMIPVFERYLAVTDKPFRPVR